MDMWTIQPTNVGNPDFGQYVPVAPQGEVAIIDSLAKAIEICEKYRDDWNLGGGNWMNPRIKHNGVDIAYVSYNLRVWLETGEGWRSEFEITPSMELNDLLHTYATYHAAKQVIK